MGLFQTVIDIAHTTRQKAVAKGIDTSSLSQAITDYEDGNITKQDLKSAIYQVENQL